MSGPRGRFFAEFILSAAEGLRMTVASIVRMSEKDFEGVLFGCRLRMGWVSSFRSRRRR